MQKLFLLLHISNVREITWVTIVMVYMIMINDALLLNSYFHVPSFFPKARAWNCSRVSVRI